MANVTDSESTAPRLRHVIVASAVIVLAVALSGLLGWVADLPLLRTFGQSVPINPSTVIALMFAGLSLLIHLRLGQRDKWGCGRVLAMLVIAIAALRLCGYLFGWHRGVDMWLFAKSLGENRMAPNTALCLCLTGFALILVGSKGRGWVRLLPGFALCAGGIALLAFAGYLYSILALYGVGRFNPMALNTALALTALSAGILCARPDLQPMAFLIRRWSAERMVVAGFSGAVLILCLSGLVCIHSTFLLIHGGADADDDLSNTVSIKNLELALQEAETGQRGYVLSGDETFLSPFLEVQKVLARRLGDLRAGVADSPEQCARLSEVEPIIYAKMRSLSATIDLRRSKGFLAASQMVTSGNGNRLMEQIRQRLLTMEDYERAQSQARMRSNMAMGRRTLWTTSVGMLVAFVIAVLAGLSILRDMSHRLAAEKALRHAMQSAEAANQSKSEFLANMSHEIRTPMTAIMGYADMLLAPGRSHSDQCDIVQTVRRQGEHLLTVINDILDISKIEAGKMEVERIFCDPCDIAADVVSLMRVRAIEKWISLELLFQGPIPLTIETDPTRLRQVLINLIGNAIKFTDTGSVKVVVALVQGASSRCPVLRFDVIDTGIGMASQELSKLFTPFQQADTSTTRRFGGSGLGLSICKRLAIMLGGDISVQSMTGVGSRFTLTVETGSLENVPLRDRGEWLAQQDSEHAAAENARLSGRVLLAEDGENNRHVITYYLEQAGLEVETAENGRIACEKAMEALRTGRGFDVILMDMQMPEMDGYTATANLRAKAYPGTIIALTAHAMQHDQQKCIESGCAQCLSKPIDRDQLFKTLAAYLTPAGSEGSAPGRSRIAIDSGVLRPTVLDEGIAKFLPKFIAALPSQVEKLVDLQARRDLDQLSAVVHQLKGTGGMYGLMQITETATNIERLIQETRSIESIATQLQSLVEMIRRVEGYDRMLEHAERPR